MNALLSQPLHVTIFRGLSLALISLRHSVALRVVATSPIRRIRPGRTTAGDKAAPTSEPAGSRAFKPKASQRALATLAWSAGPIAPPAVTVLVNGVITRPDPPSDFEALRIVQLPSAACNAFNFVNDWSSPVNAPLDATSSLTASTKGSAKKVGRCVFAWITEPVRLYSPRLELIMRHLQLDRGAGFRRQNNEQELRRPTPKCLSFKRFLEIRSGDHPNWNIEPAVRLINS